MADNTPGGVKLDVVVPNFDDRELDGFGPEVHVVLTRSACARVAQIFAKAGESAAGSLALGSPEATTFTRELNDLLARGGNALFWDCAIDDSVGAPVGPPSRLAEVAAGASGCAGPWLAIGLALLALRGAFALWRDLDGL